ncbi:serine/threonine-protein kinase [Pirellulaceae bacterium SH449]
MMDLPNSACNEELLKQLLASDNDFVDSTPGATGVFEHLEICPRCQAKLNELAASDMHWTKAKSWLQGCHCDGELRTSHHGTPGFEQDVSCTVWSKSMAEQLLSPPSHPEMLGRIGRYDVERLIGSGGMGIVFKAYDSDLNRPVAIKVLAPYLAGNGAARQRFAREAKAAAAVVHEHVVPIHNVEANTVSPYLVMHYVTGESLQSRIDRNGALATCEILRISMQIASGLAAAHAHGLVHRDIKPPNILLEHGVERSLITDFGLARTADDASLTNTGVHAGTPQYMSPEQAKGESLDSRSDLFSLGSTMYAMCTGRAPFRADTAYGILRKIVETEPHPIRDLNPSIPDWLCKIVARLMRKDADARISSARELADLLSACLAHLQMPLENPLPESLHDANPVYFREIFKPVATRSNRLLRILFLFACCVCLGGIAWFLWTGFAQSKPTTHEIFNEETRGNGKEPESVNQEDARQSAGMDQLVIRSFKEDEILDKLASTMIEPAIALPLKDLVAFIAVQIDVPCIWNGQTFSDSLVDLAKAIDLVGDLSAREALALACDSVEAAYIVREDSIEICSREYAQHHPAIRFYDLKHVLRSSDSARSVVHAVESIIGMGDGTSTTKTPVSLLGSVLVVRTTETKHVLIEQLLSKLAISFHAEFRTE